MTVRSRGVVAALPQLVDDWRIAFAPTMLSLGRCGGIYADRHCIALLDVFPPMDATSPPRTVFLIDDHPIVALGLRIALAGHGALRFLDSAVDPVEGLKMATTLQPDCLVLDLVYSGTVAIGEVAAARARLPIGVIVAFSSLPARSYAREALGAGADAFLGKDADMAELVALLDRTRPISMAPIADVSHGSQGWANAATIDGVHLTRRELQVATAIAAGMGDDAIAARLALSPNTIAAHRDNIRRKLGCRNSRELVARLAPLSGARTDD